MALAVSPIEEEGSMTQDPSPVLQKPRFDVTRRGYERSQVDQHIAKLHLDVTKLMANLRQEREYARSGSQQLLAERDNALQQLQAVRAELQSLRASADEATVELRRRDEISLFGGRLQTILMTAEQEAEAARAEALELAQRVRSQAEQDAETLLSRARKEADTVLGQAMRESESLRAQARQETEELRAQTRQEAEELQARTRQEAEELQSSTERETGTLLAEAREQAARLTEEANAEAQRVTTSARQEAAAAMDAARREEGQVRASLAELAQRREQVHRELTGIRTTIETLLGEIAGAGLEPAAEASATKPAARQHAVQQPAGHAPAAERPATPEPVQQRPGSPKSADHAADADDAGRAEPAVTGASRQL